MRPLRIVMIAAVAGCAGATSRDLQEPASPPAQAEAVTPRPERRAPEQRVALCVVRERRIEMMEGVIDPETGDSLLAGRPWREVHSERTAPYAAHNPWYISGRGLLPPGRQFPMDKYGLPRVLTPGDLRYWGEYEGVPVFVEAENGATMPDVAYVPVRPGCESVHAGDHVRAVRG